MLSALLSCITRRIVVISYRRFGTNYRSHLQGSRNPRYVRNMPERRTSHLLRGGSLKSRKILMPSFPLGMPRRSWIVNVKMHLRETGREGVN